MPRVFQGLQAPPGPLRTSAFHLDWFRQQVDEWGHTFRWEHAARCPCAQVFGVGDYAVSTKRGREGCTQCQGIGWEFFGAQTVKALSHAAEFKTESLQPYGELPKGSCGITFLPEHIPGFRDRLVDLSEVRQFSEVFERKGATSDQPTYPIAVETIVVGSDADAAISDTTERGVQYMTRAGPDGVHLGEVVQDDDFTIVDGRVVWNDATGTNVPAIGDMVGITYTAHPVYRIERTGHIRTAPTYAPQVVDAIAFKGFFDADGGDLPTGDDLLVGDFFETRTGGTVDAVEFAPGDHLVVARDAPGATLADGWLVLNDAAADIGLEHLTHYAVCMMESLGDPLERSGTP